MKNDYPTTRVSPTPRQRQGTSVIFDAPRGDGHHCSPSAKVSRELRISWKLGRRPMTPTSSKQAASGQMETGMRRRDGHGSEGGGAGEGQRRDEDIHPRLWRLLRRQTSPHGVEGLRDADCSGWAIGSHPFNGWLMSWLWRSPS